MPIPLQRTLRLSQELPHPAGHVWRAVADRELLSRWFMPTHDLELWVGHGFTFRKPPRLGWNGVTQCEILEVVPGRTLAFSYRTADGLLAELDTVLRFTVESRGPDRSCLRLEHTGFSGPKSVLASLVLGRGWKKFLRERLPETLAFLGRA